MNVFLLPGNCLRHTFVARPPPDAIDVVAASLTALGPVRLVSASADAFRFRVPLAGKRWQRRRGGGSPRATPAQVAPAMLAAPCDRVHEAAAQRAWHAGFGDRRRH